MKRQSSISLCSPPALFPSLPAGTIIIALFFFSFFFFPVPTPNDLNEMAVIPLNAAEGDLSPSYFHPPADICIHPFLPTPLPSSSYLSFNLLLLSCCVFTLFLFFFIPQKICCSFLHLTVTHPPSFPLLSSFPLFRGGSRSCEAGGADRGAEQHQEARRLQGQDPLQ